MTEVGRWSAGETIFWCYEHGVFAVQVVEDRADRLVTWQALDAPGLIRVMADGRPTRDRPVADRFTDPRVWAIVPWTDTSVLRIHVLGTRHSVWQMYVGSEPVGWYVNLEDAHRRSPHGTHTEDHTLDVWVDLDGTSRLKDEDELEAVVALGLRTPAGAAEIHAEAARVQAAAARRDAPYDGAWLDWRPDPAWALPVLPADLAAWAGRPGDEVPEALSLSSGGRAPGS